MGWLLSAHGALALPWADVAIKLRQFASTLALVCSYYVSRCNMEKVFSRVKTIKKVNDTDAYT